MGTKTVEPEAPTEEVVEVPEAEEEQASGAVGEAPGVAFRPGYALRAPDGTEVEIRENAYALGKFTIVLPEGASPPPLKRTKVGGGWTGEVVDWGAELHNGVWRMVATVKLDWASVNIRHRPDDQMSLWEKTVDPSTLGSNVMGILAEHVATCQECQKVGIGTAIDGAGRCETYYDIIRQYGEPEASAEEEDDGPVHAYEPSEGAGGPCKVEGCGEGPNAPVHDERQLDSSDPALD